MGKGKKWSAEELKHLAEAWIAISEDSGEAMVKGTNQDSDEFWRRIYNVFISRLHQQWLGKPVGWLILRVNSFEVERSIVPCGVLHEVEVLAVDCKFVCQ